MVLLFFRILQMKFNFFFAVLTLAMFGSERGQPTVVQSDVQLLFAMISRRIF